MASSPHPAAPLLRALQDCILPALEWNVRAHAVIAKKNRKFLDLPPGVQAIPLKLLGRRVAVRSSKAFQRAVFLSAKWPLDGMQELRIPKLVAVVEGAAGLRAGDYVLQCPAGTVLFLPPGVPHTDNTFSHLETLYPGTLHCSLLWITPMVSGLTCRMCHYKGEEHSSATQGEKVFLHRQQVSQLFYMLAEVVEEVTLAQLKGHETDKFNMPLFESLFLSLMRTILRDIHSEQFLLQEIPPHEGEEHSIEDDPIEQAMQFLKTHYASPLTLDDVARRFFLSRAQFTRKFRERAGQSFLEYLNERRLEQARKLLLETDWTAIMIARYVGFASPAHFYHLFSRNTGLTPMQFRKRERATNKSNEAT